MYILSNTKDLNERQKKAAEYIIKGVKKEKKVIQFPLSQVFIIRLTDLFPSFAYDLQPVDLMKGEGYPEPESETREKKHG